MAGQTWQEGYKRLEWQIQAQKDELDKMSDAIEEIADDRDEVLEMVRGLAAGFREMDAFNNLRFNEYSNVIDDLFLRVLRRGGK
jgi:hypothetical protein